MDNMGETLFLYHLMIRISYKIVKFKIDRPGYHFFLQGALVFHRNLTDHIISQESLTLTVADSQTPGYYKSV